MKWGGGTDWCVAAGHLDLVCSVSPSESFEE